MMTPYGRDKIDTIKEVVALYYGIDLSVMRAKTREGLAVRARHVAMYFVDKELRGVYSQLSLANEFSRHYATFIHACKQIALYVETEEQLRVEIARLTEMLSQKGIKGIAP